MHTRTRSRFFLVPLAAAALSACSADVITRAPSVAASVAATGDVTASRRSSGQTITITDADVARQPENTPPTRNWVLYTRALGTGVFRVGPGTPPLGIGSLELSTPTSADKVTLFNYDEIGTRLSAVSSMSYATYRTSGSLQQVAALNMEIDYNGPGTPGGFSTLVFEPVYNPAQGPVVSGQWQTWDAYNGGQAIWWSTRPIPGVCAFTCYVTWNQIVAANPNATILGGFGINQGSGNPGLVTAVDALHFDTPSRSVTWNFEPFRTPTNKDDCKNGGWRTVKRADGTSFRNQGECVSYVDHREDNDSDHGDRSDHHDQSDHGDHSDDGHSRDH
jgi:hypothetical protein